MRNLFLCGLWTALVALSGCSSMFGSEGYFRDRGNDYLKSDVLPSMTFPDGVEPRSIDQLYVIPPISESDEPVARFEVPRPLSLADSAFSERVKIQKLDNRRWILVAASPAEVWPQVRSFLSRNGLDVVYTDAAAGVIETAWLRFVNDPDSANRYRLRIEQGIQTESTEIHVLHQSIAGEPPSVGALDWPSRSVSDEREGWMIDELAGTIATDSSSSQAASLMAQAIGSGKKVDLETEGEEPVLVLQVDRKRAFATVTHSLSQGGFSLLEQDRDRGIFYVSYDPDYEENNGKKPGIFARIFKPTEEQPGLIDRLVNPATVAGESAGQPYSLEEIVAHLQLQDTAVNRRIFPGLIQDNVGLHEVPGLLVVAYSDAGSVELRIRDAYGQQLPRIQARRLLSLVRQNLI